VSRVKVLVVDDSAMMRRVISSILRAHPAIEVVGTARNGLQALEMIAGLRPDVVTLDLEMPVMNGIETLDRIMSGHPTPVVVISSLTQEEADATVECLEKGAFDCVAKPSGGISLDLDRQAQEIIAKVLVAARSRTCGRPRAITAARMRRASRGPMDGDHAVAIGASTGGPRNLMDVIPALPANIGVPIFVVQHMPATFTGSFAERLNAHSAVGVKEAEPGDAVRGGMVYIAPGGQHMTVVRTGPRKKALDLSLEPDDTLFRPSVDVLMTSVATVYRRSCTGVLMTGMGNDGAQGMLAIKRAGGPTIAEDESTCIVFGMPRAAIACGAADIVAPSHRIAAEIVRILRQGRDT